MNNITSFGSYLNELLTVRDMDKKQFAITMNINRSVLYRFLGNEQLPSRDQLNEISQKLNLRISEQNKLIESYECSLYGWEIVKGRNLMTDMLNNLNDKIRDKGIAYEYTFRTQVQEGDNTGIITVKNKENVVNTVLSLLASVRQDTDVSHVRMILQPGLPDFASIFTKILNEITDSKRAISIQHIIRFKDNLLKKNKLHNLQILDYLLPLSFFENIYGVYYATDDLTTDAYGTFFPNFISIGSKEAFVFSADYENGLLYTSKSQKTIEMMNEEFTKISDDCLPLFVNLQTYEQQSAYMYEYEQLTQTSTSLLHPEIGFYSMPFDILRKKEQEQFIPHNYAQILIKRMEAFRERLEKSRSLEIISIKGLRSFAATGQPRILGNIKFSKSERIEILRNIIKFIKEKENYSLYLMKEGHPFYDSDFAVKTVGNQLLYIVPSYTDFKITNNIIIRNESIIETFNDFLHSDFTAQDTITDRNEVVSFISDIIKSIQEL